MRNKKCVKKLQIQNRRVIKDFSLFIRIDETWGGKTKHISYKIDMV